MMNDSFKSSKPRVIKANHLLEAKVGSGDVAPEKINRMQSVMDSNSTDFTPLAHEHLEKLAVALKAAHDKTLQDPALLNALIDPVMQLKGNAPMFHYPLVGNLANIMLGLLESITEIDDTVLEIIDAHHKTLSIIIKNQMTGGGGDYGMQLQSELSDACKRYFAKKGLGPTTSIDDAYFID